MLCNCWISHYSFPFILTLSENDIHFIEHNNRDRYTLLKYISKWASIHFAKLGMMDRWKICHTSSIYHSNFSKIPSGQAKYSWAPVVLLEGRLLDSIVYLATSQE